MEALLKVENLKKYFPVKKSFIEELFTREKRFLRAVDGISFEIARGETLGLVGESGSGKTTVGRLVLRLLDPTEGKVFFDGEDITSLSGEELRRKRRNFQVVFQDPMASLNPHMKIGEAIRHPLVIHGIGTEKEQKREVLKMLDRMGLVPPESFYEKYPHELSGGQRQRAVIARALILRPKFVVADEAVAMLDVSVRAKLLELMIELKKEFNLTYLFITHDLATAKYICDRIAVMYLGKLVELGNLRSIYTSPKHPYTKALLSAVPFPDPKVKWDRFLPPGEVPNPINPPSGCRFHPRCPLASPICSREEPALAEVSPGHLVACHNPLR
ncbi:MAG: ABC transporter ATP-binding protein [Synergistetes bacterium]|nr:ABC transporter ATP-binding protein [Synergistota bacterium]